MRTLPSISLRIPGLWAVAILAALGPVQADISLPKVPPPQPEPVRVRVYLGESVDIPLSGVSRSGAGLQFTIRRQPGAGRLSEIRMVGPNRGLVTYTHDPRAGVGTDTFRYAASAPGIGVSTPATVTIDVINRPSVFTAPARLDFPDTPVGHESRMLLEVRNDGGSRVDGQLSVPAPWYIEEGDGTYALGPGEMQVIPITFKPTEVRQFAETGLYSHAPGLELGLGGRGFAPVEIAPRVIHLEPDGRNETRTGTLLLRNTSEEDRSMTITVPEQVIAPKTVALPAGTEQQVQLKTQPGFLGSLDDKIMVSEGVLVLTAPLKVAAAPARLVVAPEKIDFGSLDLGRSESVKITIKNVGGSPADLKVLKPEGVVIEPDPTYTPIAAGQSREYTMSYGRSVPGRLSGTVVIDSGDVGVRLPVTAEIRKEDYTAAAKAAAQEAKKPQEVTYNSIPPVEQLGVTKQTKTELDLTWKKAPDATGYIIFLKRTLFDAKGSAKIEYKRLDKDKAKVRFVRDEARVSFVGLRPGEQVTIVIVAEDAAGQMSRPSAPFTVATLPSKPWSIPWKWLAVLAILAFVVLIIRERRRVRAASDAEVEEMARRL